MQKKEWFKQVDANNINIKVFQIVMGVSGDQNLVVNWQFEPFQLQPNYQVLEGLGQLD